MNRTFRKLVTLLPAVLLLPALIGAGPPENRLYLSAGGPFGAKGAREAFAPVCDDTVHRDTLYLCFEPARDESTFFGFSAEVMVYAAPGETLGTFWQMERGGANNGGLTVQFGPDETFPAPQPWGTAGVGSALYDRTSASARFRFLCAVPMGAAQPVRAGTRYVLGRMLLGARHAGLSGCERAVCLEWHSASIAYRATGQENVERGGSRWLARGGDPGGCRERIPAWRPKGLGTGTAETPEGPKH